MNWQGRRSITLPWLPVVVITAGVGLYLALSLWAVLQTATDIIVVVFVGWLIAAVVRRFSWWVHARTGASFRFVAISSFLTVLVVVFGGLIALVPLAISQAAGLAKQLPALMAETPPFLQTLQNIADELDLEVNIADAYQQDFRAQISGSLGTWVRENAVGMAQRTANGLLRGVFILALSIYLILDWDRLKLAVKRLTPDGSHEGIKNLYERFESIFLRWLVGILTIATLFGTATFIVMTIFDLPYSLPVSALAGFLVVLPYVGDLFAILLPALLASLDQSIGTGILVAAILALFDFVIINMIISPRLMGSAVKLPAALVLISVIISGKVLGPLGAIVGVPVGGFVYMFSLAIADFAKGRTHVFAEASDTDDDGIPDSAEPPDALDPK